MDSKLKTETDDALHITLNQHLDKHTFVRIIYLINQFVEHLDVEGKVESAKAIKQILLTKLEQKTPYSIIEELTIPNYTQKLRFDIENDPDLIEKCARLEQAIAQLLAIATPPEPTAAISYYQDAITKLNHPKFENNIALIRLAAQMSRNKANCYLELAKQSDSPATQLQEAEQSFEYAQSAYLICIEHLEKRKANNALSKAEVTNLKAFKQTVTVLKLAIISIRGQLVTQNKNKDIRSIMNVIMQLEELNVSFALQAMLKLFEEIFRKNYEEKWDEEASIIISNTTFDEDVQKFVMFTELCRILSAYVDNISQLDMVNNFSNRHFFDINQLLIQYSRSDQLMTSARMCDYLIDYIDIIPTIHSDYLANWIKVLNSICKSHELLNSKDAEEIMQLLKRAHDFILKCQIDNAIDHQQLASIQETIRVLSNAKAPVIPSAARIINNHTAIDSSQKTLSGNDLPDVATMDDLLAQVSSVANKIQQRDITEDLTADAIFNESFNSSQSSMTQNKKSTLECNEIKVTSPNNPTQSAQSIDDNSKSNVSVEKNTNTITNTNTATKAKAKKTTKSKKTANSKVSAFAKARMEILAGRGQTITTPSSDILASPENLLRQKMLLDDSTAFNDFIKTSYIALNDHHGLYKHMTDILKRATTYKKFNLDAVNLYMQYTFTDSSKFKIKVMPVNINLALRLTDDFANELSPELLIAVGQRYLEKKQQRKANVIFQQALLCDDITKAQTVKVNDAIAQCQIDTVSISTDPLTGEKQSHDITEQKTAPEASLHEKVAVNANSASLTKTNKRATAVKTTSSNQNKAADGAKAIPAANRKTNTTQSTINSTTATNKIDSIILEDANTTTSDTSTTPATPALTPIKTELTASRVIEDSKTNTCADDFRFGIDKAKEEALRQLDNTKKIDFANHLFNSGLKVSREAAIKIMQFGSEAGDLNCKKRLCEMHIQLAETALSRVNKILAGKRPLSTDNETIAHNEYLYAEKQMQTALDIKDNLMSDAPSSWRYKTSVQLVSLRKSNKNIIMQMRTHRVSPTNFMDNSSHSSNKRWDKLQNDTTVASQKGSNDQVVPQKTEPDSMDPKKHNPSKGFFNEAPDRKRLSDINAKRQSRGAIGRALQSLIGV